MLYFMQHVYSEKIIRSTMCVIDIGIIYMLIKVTVESLKSLPPKRQSVCQWVFSLRQTLKYCIFFLVKANVSFFFNLTDTT